MGTFTVEIEIGDSRRERWATMNALVDTGATMTSAPASVFRGLGIEPVTRKHFELAQGEVRAMEVGYTWLRFAGEEILTQVMFNEEGTPPILGAIALENAFMGVDPVAQRLIPVSGLMMQGRQQSRGRE